MCTREAPQRAPKWKVRDVSSATPVGVQKDLVCLLGCATALCAAMTSFGALSADCGLMKTREWVMNEWVTDRE